VGSRFSVVPGGEPFCGWQEINDMQRSGVIDFESHSLFHHRVFVSPAIEDFYHPGYDSGPANLNMPVVRSNGMDNIARVVEFGMPIYRSAARLRGHRRFYDDERLRIECIEYVRARGGESFFKDPRWRSVLSARVRAFQEKHQTLGVHESDGELKEALLDDLTESRRRIEAKLPGKTVKHLCYPWWEGSGLASGISKKAGYLTNFWGILPGRRTNRRDDDPYKIVRLLSEDYVYRLPGDERRPLLGILKNRILHNYKRLLSGLTTPY
jgi:hypothetical protein